MLTRTKLRLLAAGALAIAGCSLQEASNRDSSAVAAAAGARATPRPWNADTWQAPIVDSTPDDPYEVAVYRGLAIVTHTRDSLPRYVGSTLNCTSCHLDEGRRPNAAPMTGSYVRYPKYIERVAAVVPIEDRINYCMTRSLAGNKLPPDSREMQDIVAYLAYISKGVPSGEHVRGEGMPKMPPLLGDSSHGAPLFAENCARCHASDGAGMGPIPALWGPNSFSIGASMARQERAASFIRHNMPFDRPGTLTDQQAFDVAAYVTSMPRPDLPNKEADWPNGGAPADLPYDTKGHKAFRPPRVLARNTDPRGAIVTAPAPVPRGK
ncbi:MAG: c-type cytochrome [Gemmatimonadaceae bacterium]